MEGPSGYLFRGELILPPGTNKDGTVKMVSQPSESGIKASYRDPDF